LRRSGIDEAWGALEEMQKEGTSIDKYTVSRMLMKTVGSSNSRLAPARVYRGIAAVERFIELQPNDVDEVLFNALLDTCCRLKDMGRLEQLVQRMRALKVTPSPVTLGILVKSYGQAGDLARVLHVWDEMAQQREQANAVTYGCMIDACVKCGRLDKAVEVFEGMRLTGKHRNTILYTTLIKGYGREKDLKHALELFYEMPREGVPYNTITYNSIIDAATKAGDLGAAESLLREMASPSSQLEPDLITFSTLLKGYCHAGELDKALQVTEAIKARGLVADELVYNTLMEGCVKASDPSAGVGLFEEMVTAGLRPSNITYSILARLYQRGGYEENAGEAVAQLCAQHGLERPSGLDRCGKNASWRRAQWPQNPTRSPGGRGGDVQQSPVNSQGLPGIHRERSESCWSASAWSDAGVYGYDGMPDYSVASTPMGSPVAATMSAGSGFNHFGMPMLGHEAPDTPYSGSCTPMGSMPLNGQMPMTGPFPGNTCPSPHDQRSQGLGSAFFPQAGTCPASIPSLPFPQQRPCDGGPCGGGGSPCGAAGGSPCGAYGVPPFPGQFPNAACFTGQFFQAGDVAGFQPPPQQQFAGGAMQGMLPGAPPICGPPPPPFGNPNVPEMSALPPQVPFLPPAELPTLNAGSVPTSGIYNELSPSRNDW
jgi:pentatricopeptide repeat protein